MDPMAETPAVRRPRPRRDEELEVTIDSLAYGGAGIGRSEGFVVFVRGALPGDRVRARIGKSKRSYAEAVVVEVLEPSPDRIEPAVPHAGAPWQVLPYERQLEEKQRQVVEALERLGGFEAPPVEQIVPAVEQLRYRNKVEYSFGEAEDGRLVLGTHRAGRWDVIDELTEDVLASERVDALRNAVADWCREQGVPAYDRRDQSGVLRNLVVREGRRTGELQARLVTRRKELAVDELAAAVPATSFLWTNVEGLGETTTGGKTVTVRGEPKLYEELDIGGTRLRFGISPEAFFQTNTEMAERLYATAAELAGLSGRQRVFDLYCGIGTIALALALDSREVVGVELVEEAVADAIANAELNGIDNARFYAGDIRTAMRPLIEEEGAADVVVVDPPRAGLSQKVVRRVLEVGAPTIVYVSCNPTTLAPNARQIVEAGYELVTVRPVDMFPQTPHIESVALLRRRPE
jgi:23S rRNA (uracil1939-C5)-methyltransferase